ncbi:MAG: large subunit ribosomal protein [Patescibacteria group bacterium]|nr:large subunit ribosomal protein [Patescibacteria group bacterium]
MADLMALKPRMSEKAYGLSQDRNIYVFMVPLTANKVTVASAVQEQFKVTVEEVNISILKGKAKRSYRRGGRPLIGRDNDVKKAYVRLKAGDQIPIFAAVEEEEAKAEKTAAAVKKAVDKKAKKESK